MAIARIRKNDTVIVTSGNDAGKTGTVMSVNPKKGTAIVAKLNVHKKAVRRTDKVEGGIVDKEMPIKLCKLMPYDADKKAGTRVRTQSVEKDGKARKQRVSAKSGKAL